MFTEPWPTRWAECHENYLHPRMILYIHLIHQRGHPMRTDTTPGTSCCISPSLVGWPWGSLAGGLLGVQTLREACNDYLPTTIRNGCGLMICQPFWYIRPRSTLPRPVTLYKLLNPSQTSFHLFVKWRWWLQCLPPRIVVRIKWDASEVLGTAPDTY